jgi:hypothetical protein
MTFLRSPRTRLGLAVAAALAVSSCSTGPTTQTAVGPVVDLTTQRVCLAGAGTPVLRCYLASSALLAGLQLGDCVKITATLRYGRVAVRYATAIEQVSIADHPDACPA